MGQIEKKCAKDKDVLQNKTVLINVICQVDYSHEYQRESC
jgi:hypothetical protein